MKRKHKIIMFIAANLISYFVCAYMSNKFDLTDMQQQEKILVLIAFAAANVIALAIIDIKGIKR